MDRISYLIVDENNNWVATGYNATLEEINDNIQEIKENGNDSDLLIFKIEGTPTSVKNGLKTLNF